MSCLLGGDLLNQIISSGFAAREIRAPFIGLYGACSTISEGLMLGGMLVDGGFAELAACAASSHFRQPKGSSAIRWKWAFRPFRAVSVRSRVREA